MPHEISSGFLDKLEVGKAVTLGLALPSLAPMLSDEAVQAILVSKDKGLWVFGLYWFGIHVGDVSAEQHKGKIEFEELG